MGNTLSPLLADLYMQDYIEKYMKDIYEQSKFWRYVDDILIIAKMNEGEITDYVKRLNKIRSKIKFTFEYEKDGKVDFCDTSLSHGSNNNIHTRWYRKLTASDRLLNYNSHHHQSIEINLIKSMTSTIIETSKNINEQKEDIKKLRNLLSKSNYSCHIIEKHIKNTINNHPTKKQKEEKLNPKQQEYKYTITIPYTKGVEVLKRKLNEINIKVFFSYPHKLQTQCTYNLKQNSKSNMYQIACTCGSIYNGETKVGIKKRIQQHISTIIKNEENSTSKLVQHHRKNKYKCKFDTRKAIIMDNEINRMKRRIKQSIYSITNNSINPHDELDRTRLSLIQESTLQIKRKIEIKSKISKKLLNIGKQDSDSRT